MHLKGFTLIELIVTVTVVSIAAAIALPLFGTIRQSKELDQSYVELESLIKQANNSAITGNINVDGLPLSFTPEAYGVHIDTTNTPVTIEYFALEKATGIGIADYRDASSIIFPDPFPSTAPNYTSIKTITLPEDMAIRAVEDRNGSVIENCNSGDLSSDFRYQLTDGSTNSCPLQASILFNLGSGTIETINHTNHETIEGYIIIVLAHRDIYNKNYIVGVDKATGKIYTKEIDFSAVGALDDPFRVTAINDDFDDLEMLNDFGNFLENFYGQ